MQRQLLTHSKTATGVVVRPRPGGVGPAQALVFLTYDVRELLHDDCTDGEPSFRLGPPIPFLRSARGDVYETTRGYHSPVYVPATNSIYFVEGHAVMRLDSSNVVSLVAGNRGHSGADDGPGPEASFGEIRAMSSDGFDTIYAAEDRRIRKLVMGPRGASAAAAHGHGGASGGEAAATAAAAHSHGASPGRGGAGGGSWGSSFSSSAASTGFLSPDFPDSPPDADSWMDSVSGSGALPPSWSEAQGCEVTTLAGSAPHHGDWVALAFDCEAEELLACTRFAVCRVSLTAPPGARCRNRSSCGGGAGLGLGRRSSGGGSDCSHGGGVFGFPDLDVGGGGRGVGVGGGSAPELVAGAWITTPCGAQVDGPGPSALFACITGMVAGPNRRLYVLDSGSSRQLRLVDSQRGVSTVASLPPPPVRNEGMAFLPVGYRTALAVCGASPIAMLWSTLGRAAAADAGGGSASGGVAGGGGELAQPLTPPKAGDASAGGDVLTVRVGPRAFLAHRSLLSLRSDYFKHLLAPDSGFAEGAATHGTPFAETELPGADPEALEALLKYVYSGVPDVPDSLLRPAAELAGRLLMPEVVCRHLAARLLAACTAATALADLLWAERHHMTRLVSELKAHALRNPEAAVTAAAPGLVEELAAADPATAAELVAAAAAKPTPLAVAAYSAARLTPPGRGARRRGSLTERLHNLEMAFDEDERGYL
ncbi:hypothetical protein GPECTOR_51g675 [Gonium pectorale]|uniref:BTB domain-containing protein n=1 Tax=Gonium pectorale TaxID=33097 RepID=A0A150G8K1_GONPE|nr:hypothetical protein GPECTOR_51g675 [Gonium pectorale]|eukprot:KXZ45690.1 hypothetical protein GPECTOR_51g675 [Gonium pectorale]